MAKQQNPKLKHFLETLQLSSITGGIFGTAAAEATPFMVEHPLATPLVGFGVGALGAAATTIAHRRGQAVAEKAAAAQGHQALRSEQFNK